MTHPLLAIVTGRPGSGKSTLAQAIAAELRCPLISRDRLKEGAIRTLGSEAATDPQVTRQIFETFFGEIELLIRSRVSLIAEAAFQHPVWAPRLIPLLGQADIRLVVCEVPAEVAVARRNARSAADPQWDAYHPPAENWEHDDYIPLKLDVPTLTVESSSGYEPELPRIVGFLT